MTIPTMNAPAKPVRKRPTTMTVERFERHPGLKGYELVDGQLDRKAMGAEASWFNLYIGSLLMAHVVAHKLGRVFDAECQYRCFPHHPRKVRKPDVSFIRKNRLPGNIVPKGMIEIAPDFVVEVMSVHDRWTRVTKKVREYLDAGVQLIWVVDPDNQTVTSYVPDQTSIRFAGDNVVSADPVVPGFQIVVSQLFSHLQDE